ncbi:hypothetical protein PUMCH_002358 [Australozyma saopauloensis]|uniref:Uncharacterized protein n=1 Tax=Australozyma saopauloensis TaxID=291208 RepID=A0AAX4H9A1_9ASCO|nr:hypothetical protein PUMCH_002358 [[Candida] saopauloensis]
MKVATILAVGSLWLTSVTAAPTIGSSASNIIKRSESGLESIDFDYVFSSIVAINDRYNNGAISSIQKRDDDDFIDQLMMEFHKHNLMDDFVEQFVNAPHLHDALEESTVNLISNGEVDEPLLVNSLRASGKLGEFFDSVLNNEELNDELYHTAQSIAEKSQAEGQFAARNALSETEPFIHTVFSEAMSPKRKRAFDEDLFFETHGMSKRDLLSSIISIVKAISNSGLVQKIVRSIIGNQSLIQYSINLFGKIFRSIDWGKLFTAIKNSGLIQKIFNLIIRLVSGFFAGSSFSSLIKEIFGGGSNSTHKSFLAGLLSSGVEVGSGLYSSLNKSSSSGLLSDLSSNFKGNPSTATGSVPLYSAPKATSGAYTPTSTGGFLSGLFLPKTSPSGSSTTTGSSSSGGFLLTLLGNLFKPKPSSSSSSNSGLSGNSSGGFFSSLLGSLFGGNKPSSSTPSSSSSSNSSSSGSGKGLLATLFDSLFPKSGSRPGTSSPSSGSSSSSSTGAGIGLGSLIGGLFGGSLSGSKPGSSTSSSASPTGAFTSAKQCCCSPNRIRQRAMKRALQAKLKRSVKRSLAAGDLDLSEGLMNFFLK